ncbi:MAG: UDP-glucose--hexose-1-phosphate uridylyltransferase [Caulobacteraceae bacterium]
MSEAPRPERRFNILNGEWVLVSPQRIARPWLGDFQETTVAARIQYDPECYLCPGNLRAGGARNPPYSGVYVFENDYPALTPGPREAKGSPDPLLVAEYESGTCRVVCYSPDHSLTLSKMSPEHFRPVVEEWVSQFAELDGRDDIDAVVIFENRGEMMGASNPHPHGQLWALSSVPTEIAKEVASQCQWNATHGSSLLEAYLARELELGERLVLQNQGFVALVPYWAVWPFETLILPRRRADCLTDLGGSERDLLARILTGLTAGYDRLFSIPFPYSMGLHQRPSRFGPKGAFIMHAHFYPPLLRSSRIRKFMVGFEMLAMPQRDLTPEEAARRLREAIASG